MVVNHRRTVLEGIPALDETYNGALPAARGPDDSSDLASLGAQIQLI